MSTFAHFCKCESFPKALSGAVARFQYIYRIISILGDPARAYLERNKRKRVNVWNQRRYTDTFAYSTY